MSNPSEMSGEPLAGNPLEESVDSASTVSQAPSPIPVPVVVRPESHETPEPAPRVHRIYRHKLPVRLAHWLNVLCLPILVMSGFQIFNAHPALYWGDRSDRDHAVFALENGFPSWATLPGEHWLAMGRRWHLFFAWVLALTGIAFGLYAMVGRHLKAD